jgi:hypothetical protein
MGNPEVIGEAGELLGVAAAGGYHRHARIGDKLRQMSARSERPGAQDSDAKCHGDLKYPDPASPEQKTRNQPMNDFMG